MCIRDRYLTCATWRVTVRDDTDNPPQGTETAFRIGRPERRKPRPYWQAAEYSGNASCRPNRCPYERAGVPVASAQALGVTRNTLSELANGKRGISPEMAVRLSKVFGGSEEGWLVQQAQYDLAQVRRDRIKLKRLEVA